MEAASTTNISNEHSLLLFEKNGIARTANNDHFRGGNELSHTEGGQKKRYFDDFLSVVSLSIPTIVINLGGTLPSFLVASFVGRRFSVLDLDGFSLASMTSNLCTLSLLSGLYSASDTLSPQAYGLGNKKEVGYIAMRGMIGSLLVLIPTILFLNLSMGRVLVALGQDRGAALRAWRWYRIYSICLPFHALYGFIWKFLSAQDVMYPLVLCVLISIGLVLPLGLYSSTTYGGTAYAVVVFEIFQALSLLAFLWIRQPHDRATWPGLCQVWNHSFQWKPFATFMLLGAGGMLASSEWIYWESVCLLVGRLGVIPLSVHTVPSQAFAVYFMVPLSVGTALAVRLGSALPVSIKHAKQTAQQTMCFGSVFISCLVAAMYYGRYSIFHLFTSDEDVLRGCELIWGVACFYALQLGLFSLLMGMCVGLGMQWTLGITTMVVLWFFGLPATYYAAIVKDGGILAVWHSLWPPYVLINAVLATAIIRADWHAIAENVRQQVPSIDAIGRV